MSETELAPMRLRALQQIAVAGKNGLIVDRGWESLTQETLVEDGLIYHEIEHGKSKFTLSDEGHRVLETALEWP